MVDSESVSSDFSSDEETELKATKINLQAFLPDSAESGQVRLFAVMDLTYLARNYKAFFIYKFDKNGLVLYFCLWGDILQWS